MSKFSLSSGRLAFSLAAILFVSQFSLADTPKVAPPKPAMPDPQKMMAAVQGTDPHQMGGAAGQNPHDGGFVSADRKNITWTLPAGWTELPPTSMRLGNFLYTHTNGQKVEIIVASLPGPAGGIAANVGMWRSQMGLPQAAETDSLKDTQKITIGGMDMTMAELVSRDNIIDNKAKARITGVIYQRGDTSWFFKMKGEDTAVKESKEAFMSFLKSLKFADEKKG